MELEQKHFFYKHKLKSMYMCLRKVSGSGHRTHQPYDSTLIALPPSYPQVRYQIFSLHFVPAFIQIVILNKLLLHTPTDCFTLCRDYQGDLKQIESSV